MIEKTHKKKEDKINLRKLQILTAAKICIMKNGFHAASMAQISNLSGLSVGGIYRYFSNKEEMINELVKGIVDKRLRLLTTLDINLADMSDIISARLGMQAHDKNFSEDNILMFEVMTEVNRNPNVATIYKEADNRMFDALLEKLLEFQKEIDIETAEAQVEIMMSIFSGTDTRSLNKRHINEIKLREFYDGILSSIFNTTISR
ncbi:TetR/AcrR family transcriptional regulator [Rouxiella badensis]|uniref:TetR/AcrR family transcriptional regulator n=2 Tax=Rahnella perminowiae TaxID=2816244 RepID=A0ABS6KV92_9GAMM|nr:MULTISPECIES: TetR/AcrR family transcriptional regulator [Yersiniaceae]MBU9833521.1 TetR/AcrR family transcriptional regulator [Rahnella perminowiae]MBU9848782.1 TetR/AcrR family transcriptional regulator [Rahnella aceris]MBU9860199.1 TetR/AcrR family transcriptional regulator [Rahnella aceris]MBU9864067.1 TetR/AcrR family transcriptional regulator [Rahnella aceris]MCC3705239.1 TetR/AcrR family transcriptional regulator [Rouxiella badensis]